MDTQKSMKQAIIEHLKNKVLWASCDKEKIYEVIREWVPYTKLDIKESSDKLADRLTFEFGSEVVDLNFLYHDRSDISKGIKGKYHLYKIA